LNEELNHVRTEFGLQNISNQFPQVSTMKLLQRILVSHPSKINIHTRAINVHTRAIKIDYLLAICPPGHGLHLAGRRSIYSRQAGDGSWRDRSSWRRPAVPSLLVHGSSLYMAANEVRLARANEYFHGVMKKIAGKKIHRPRE